MPVGSVKRRFAPPFEARREMRRTQQAQALLRSQLRRTRLERDKMRTELEYQGLRAVFRIRENLIKEKISRAPNLAELMQVFFEIPKDLQIGEGVAVYRYSDESSNLWCVARGVLQDKSRYITPQPILPGEKRFLIKKADEAGYPEKPTHILVVDRLNDLGRMEEADRVQAEADFEADLKRYFGENYRQEYADRLDQLREALRYNIYYLCPGYAHYRAIIMVNNHAENAELVRAGRPPLPLFPDQDLRDTKLEALENLQTAMTTQLKLIDQQRNNDIKDFRLQAQNELSEAVADALGSFKTEGELIDIIIKTLPKDFMRTDKESYVERASIMLYNEEEGVLRIKGSMGLRPEIIRDTVVHPGEGIAGTVFKTGKAILALDAKSADIFKNVRDPSRVASGSFMSVPIRFKGEILGVLNVRSAHPRAFRDIDLNYLETLANNLASGLKLREPINLDGLTRLYAHTPGINRLETLFQISREKRKPLACLMIDLDHFKHTNDSYGHPAGDIVLIKLANIIRDFMRRLPQNIMDHVAMRYGGEEFVIGLLNCPREQAEKLAEELRQLIEQALFDLGDGLIIRKTASVGIAVNPLHAAYTTDALIEYADRALYGAKHQGRNRAVLFNPEDPTMIQPKHSLQ